MPVNTEEFLRAIAILADDNNLRVTVKQSGKGAAICGTICFIGGLVGGPGNLYVISIFECNVFSHKEMNKNTIFQCYVTVGMAVGGAIGGVTAYKVTNGSKLKFEFE